MILDGNLRALHTSDESMKAGLRFKMRTEVTICMLGAIVNAISMGVGGSAIQVFNVIVNRIVDFGDALYIRAVIQKKKLTQ